MINYVALKENSDNLTTCKMTVVWIKNCLRLNEKEDQILNYANSVYHSLTFI